MLEAAAHPPLDIFRYFLASLLETVRVNIGECMAAAYPSMQLHDATIMLMYQQPEVGC